MVLLNPGDESLDEVLVQMSNLGTLYDRAKKMPIWPFNTQMIIRFASLILISFIPILVKLFVEGIVSSTMGH